MQFFLVILSFLAIFALLLEEKYLFMQEIENYTPESKLTTEEMARQWWQQRFGTSLPEDVKTWLRSIIRQEVVHARIEANRLDDLALQRVREGRRLQQTKLSNVEENLQRVRIQQERTQRFIELNTELEQQRKKLFEINKQQATVLAQQRELDRFETFEPINGRFQRIHTLTQGINLSRQMTSQLSLKIEEAKKKDADISKELFGEQEKMQGFQDALIQAALIMAEAERQTEQAVLYHAVQKEAVEAVKMLAERKTHLQKQLDELTFEDERMNSELSELKLKRQALEAHYQMIAKAGAIQTLLDELLEAMRLRDELSSELYLALRQQNERNEQLGRLFTVHQNLIATIQTKQEEVDGHRRSNAGMDSFSLQRRALELQSRKMMLETGLSLWRNIASGYNLMDQKSQIISSMRLTADHLNRAVDAMETEVRKLERELQQKRYHGTLSKSQNVIELRGDLEEGVACTVCGSQHHPWRSEGINGQSALISSLKAECEKLETELHGKKEQLKQQKDELTTTIAKLEVETANFQLLQTRQKQDTDEWLNFASLDRSFNECSRSTNREARTTMMRQLIEKTAVDAEDAEKELNAFTFHLNAISRISVEIQQLQQESSELTTRLNEVNTACQVMAGQVERLNQRLASATKNYSQRYETLVHEITIPDWFKEWKAAPESIKLRIQEMASQWEAIGQDIQDHQLKICTYNVQIALLKKAISEVQTDILQTDSRRLKAEELGSKAENNLQKILPQTDGKTHFQNARNALYNQKESLTKKEEEYKISLKHVLSLTAQLKNLEAIVLRDENRVAEERKDLDIWMRQYNANNPPVQFAELERLLADGNNWSEIRKSIREISLEAAITQARVIHLKSQIIALQAEGIKPDMQHSDEEQQKLRLQQEELEQQRRTILKQIAHFDEQIRAHEQATSAIGESFL